MQLEHKFSVPVPIDQAWDVLLDVERIAPCMPGATVESFDGETIVGRVKVKVGPIQVTYAGTAKFTEKDADARHAVITASAKESRGTGTANATISAQLTDTGGSSTDVTVTTDLAITGKPAQFGRGVMVEVGNKILGRFADCLSETLAAGEEPAEAEEEPALAVPAEAGATGTGAPAGELSGGGDTGDDSPGAGDAVAGIAAATTGAAAPVATPSPSPRPKPRPAPDRRPPQHEAIDLLDAAGLPVLKRLAPIAAGLLALVVIWRVLARRS